MTERRVVAVVLAAGEGLRMTSPVPKILIEVAGRTVLGWSLRAFGSSSEIDSIVVVAHPDHLATVARIAGDHAKVEMIVPGGPTRAASTRAALDAIPDREGVVLVHDAARPALEADTVSRLVAAMAGSRAATVAVPARDTILRVDGSAIVDVPDRATLWHAQTPQAFSLTLLRRAHAAASAAAQEFTDDCGIVLAYEPGLDIRIVAGTEDNLKVTTQGDLELLGRILAGRDAPAPG